MNHIFDRTFNGMGRSELYRSLIAPELFPHEKPMLIDNWDPQDREMYCGGKYTKGYYPRLVKGAA